MELSGNEKGKGKPLKTHTETAKGVVGETARGWQHQDSPSTCSETITKLLGGSFPHLQS